MKVTADLHTVHVWPATSPWAGTPCWQLACDRGCTLPVVRDEGSAYRWKLRHEENPERRRLHG